MSAEAVVLNYKRLAEVERAFRTLKGVDLQIRPIRHRLEARVKAHIFLSMLAYYVQWHLATIARNTMRRTDARTGEAAFSLTTRPNPKQSQALDLAAAIAV